METKPLNLRFQEYKLALQYFRASALIAQCSHWNKADTDRLILRLFDYCYYRYRTFDLSVDVSKRNLYSVKALQAKEFIISYLERYSPNVVIKYCNKIFGVGNWSHVLPSDDDNND